MLSTQANTEDRTTQSDKEATTEYSSLSSTFRDTLSNTTEMTDDSYFMFGNYSNKIGLQLTLFVYAVAYSMTYLVEESFVQYKLCRFELGFTHMFCSSIDELPENDNRRLALENEFVMFDVYTGLLKRCLPFFAAVAIHSHVPCVDKRVWLIAVLYGRLLYTITLAVCSVMEWSATVTVIVTSIPFGLTGGEFVLFMYTATIVAENTTSGHRTFHMIMTYFFYSIGSPIGVYAGTYAFQTLVGRSYFSAFLMSTAVCVFLVLTGLLCLTSVVGNDVYANDNAVNSPNVIMELNVLTVESDTVVPPNTTATTERPVEDRYRIRLLGLLMCFALAGVQREEERITYLYTNGAYGWDILTYAVFQTYKESVAALGLFFGATLLDKLMGTDDVLILATSSVSALTARLVYITGFDHALYVGVWFSFFGRLSGPVICSAVSKITTRNGIFALFALDAMSSVVSSALFAFVYTSHSAGPKQDTFLVVTALTQLASVFVAVSLYLVEKEYKKNEYRHGRKMWEETVFTNGNVYRHDRNTRRQRNRRVPIFEFGDVDDPTDTDISLIGRPSV